MFVFRNLGVYSEGFSLRWFWRWLWLLWSNMWQFW